MTAVVLVFHLLVLFLKPGETGFGFGDLGSRLADSVRAVLVEWEKRILIDRIKARWRGWNYVGRPPGAEINVSLQGWKSRIETSENQATLIIENEARDWRTGTRAYVAYVHRAGSVETEVASIWADLQATDIPAMRADLTAAVLRSIAAPARRRKVRRSTGGPTATMELEG